MTIETFLKQILEQPPPADLSPAALGKWIYVHHFVRRHDRPTTRSEKSPVSLAERFQTACLSPNAWVEIVPDHIDGDVLHTTYQNMHLIAYPDDWHTKNEKTEIRIPRFVEGEDGWFRYTAGPLQPSPSWYSSRLYVQTSPEGAGLLIQQCSELAENDESFAVKVALDEEMYRERWDTCVVYFSKPQQGLIPSSLESVIQKLERAAILQSKDMPLVLEVIPGVGYAENPKGNESFGEHRCRLIAEGLSQCRPDASFEEKIEAIIKVWRKAGLNPEEPWVSTLDPSPVSTLKSSHFAPHGGSKTGRD